MEYPVYSLRSFTDKYIEDNKIIIETYYNTYILDDLNLVSKIPDYVKRRLYIEENKELYNYKLYPLSNKFTNLVQINRFYRETKNKHYIDINGSIFVYKPTKRVQVVWKRPKYIAGRYPDTYLAIVRDMPYPFLVNKVYKYIAITTIYNSAFIYDVSDDQQKLNEYFWRKI
jgi:hypothetical protein